MKFKCDSCGACCKEVGNVIKNALLNTEMDKNIRNEILAFPYSFDNNGVCSMLKDNKCTVYDERPTICSVDKMYDYYKEFPKQVYYTETYKMCELLKAKYDRIGN